MWAERESDFVAVQTYDKFILLFLSISQKVNFLGVNAHYSRAVPLKQLLPQSTDRRAAKATQPLDRIPGAFKVTVTV